MSCDDPSEGFLQKMMWELEPCHGCSPTFSLLSIGALQYSDSPGRSCTGGMEGGGVYSTVQYSAVQYSAVQSTRVFTSGSVSSLWAGSQRSRVDIRQCYSVTVLHSEIYPKTTISTNKRIFLGKGKYLVCSGCLVVLSRLTRLTRLFKLFHHFISINTLCK